MIFHLHSFPGDVEIIAEPEALAVVSVRDTLDLSRRDNWPTAALKAHAGWRTAVQIEQLVELGLAEVDNGRVLIRYANFEPIAAEMPASLINSWVDESPFLLKIDRKSDVGRKDFEYRYQFLLGGRPVHVDRLGYYVRYLRDSLFILDTQMFVLVESMDAFNALSPDAKTLQESWLTFAKVKGCATEVGAILDSALQKNDVVVPSTIGLDMREDTDGALSFLPRCPELATEEFHQVFERNPGAEKFYSLDRPGLGRVRIVLTDGQHEVLRRMKRVRRVTGETKERLKRDPVQAFDGVADSVDLPYSERVVGIGEFKFTPVPRPSQGGEGMGALWQEAASGSIDGGGSESEPNSESPHTEMSVSAPEAFVEEVNTATSGLAISKPSQRAGAEEPENADGIHPMGKKVLLIKTNEETIEDKFLEEAEKARRLAEIVRFQCPAAFRKEFSLHPHQRQGVQWLQTCIETEGRQGVLLADDMGVGKTIQILTFLAWCIETGKLPDLAKLVPPFRPILIVVPLILLETRTWQKEMEHFFTNEGSIFWPTLPLHGGDLARFRRLDAEGPELDVGKPALDLRKLQDYRVVITNYETLKNYQHSFAHFVDGKPLWSVVVADEAQEFKIPSSKISHAMKALKADFQVACTGTPVENRLLDLWNIGDTIQPGLLSSAKDFVDRFENGVNRGSRDEDLEGLKRTLLFQKPHAFLLRRNKSDVTELPAKHIKKVFCDMSEQEIELHQMLLRELQGEQKSSKFFAVLHRFAQLSQHPILLSGDGEDRPPADLISASSKLKAVIEHLHFIRGKRDKALIFARHRAMQSILAKVLEYEFHLPVRIINGETKAKSPSFRNQGQKTRSGILEDFKSRPGFNLLILSPFVAGIGLTITEANHVFHYGRWWNPAVESQATDRAYRIGQTKEVFVYVPILHDASGRVAISFDERLDALMERKYRLAEDFLRPLPPEEDIGSELLGELSHGDTRRPTAT